jgi:hypothetical protein
MLEYYSAVDMWIESIEKAPVYNITQTASPSINEHSVMHAQSNAKHYYDCMCEKARNALLSYTHAGTHRSFPVKYRRLLEELDIFRVWRRSTNLYYFAIAWQYKEWYDHIIKSYYDDKALLYERLFKLSNKKSLNPLSKQIELLEEQLESLAEGDDEICRKKAFLDVWIELLGISLASSEKEEVIDWVYNRLF